MNWIVKIFICTICVLCIESCCLNTKAWFPTHAPEDTHLLSPIIVEYPYYPDFIKYYKWPNTQYSNKILSEWWNNGGKNEGKLINSYSYIVPSEKYKLYFSDKVVIGFSNAGDKIYYNSTLERDCNEYDRALYEYLKVLVESSKPIDFKQGTQKVKEYRQIFRTNRVILPEFVFE